MWPQTTIYVCLILLQKCRHIPWLVGWGVGDGRRSAGTRHLQLGSLQLRSAKRVLQAFFYFQACLPLSEIPYPAPQLTSKGQNKDILAGRRGALNQMDLEPIVYCLIILIQLGQR